MRLINLNCITNSGNRNTYVTWRGNEYELSEDEHDSVETCSNVIIYKLIVTVLLLVILQNKKFPHISAFYCNFQQTKHTNFKLNKIIHWNSERKKALGSNFVSPHITNIFSLTVYFCIYNVLMLDVITASIGSHLSRMSEFIDRNSLLLNTHMIRMYHGLWWDCSYVSGLHLPFLLHNWRKVKCSVFITQQIKSLINSAQIWNPL